MTGIDERVVTVLGVEMRVMIVGEKGEMDGVTEYRRETGAEIEGREKEGGEIKGQIETAPIVIAVQGLYQTWRSDWFLACVSFSLHWILDKP